jgi:peptide chain release factor 1
MALADTLGQLIARHKELSDMLAAGEGFDPSDYGKLSKELSDLTPVVETALAIRQTDSEMADAAALLADKESDAEMREMAEEEMQQLKQLKTRLEHELKIALLPKDEADTRNAILEVRAGTGGDEAALFAADLFRMYQRFAERKGWKFEVMDVNETGIGGYKEATANISGRDVFAAMKFESGVHRVQRVPETESGGRIHTSAATVAVLPEAQDVDIEIRDEDIRIDTMRASGAGGQHVNTTDSAVRITHLPTGIIVTSSEKSQHQNRRAAMQVLRARLYDMEREKAAKERSDARKGMVGSGDRSERIRTYNFPQGRVTDHRVNLTLYKLNEAMDGDLNEIIATLQAEDQAAMLAAIGDDAA